MFIRLWKCKNYYVVCIVSEFVAFIRSLETKKDPFEVKSYVGNKIGVSVRFYTTTPVGQLLQ